MATTVRTHRANVTGEMSFSWLTWLIGIPGAQIVVALLGSFDSAATATISIAVSALVAAIFIVGTRWLIPQTTTDDNSTRLLVAGTYVVAATVTAVALDVAFVLWAVDQSITWQRIVTGALFFVWCLGITGLVRNERAVLVAARRRLFALKSQLASATTWTVTDFASTRQVIIDRIQHSLRTLTSQVSAVETRSSTLDASVSDIVKNLLTEVEDLKFTSVGSDVPADITNKKHRSVRDVFLVASRSSGSIIPIASAFIASTWVVTGISMSNAIVATLAPILSAMVLAIALFAIHRLWEKTGTVRSATRAFVPALFRWALAGAVSGIGPVVLAGIPIVVLIPMAIQVGIVIAAIAMAWGFRQSGVDVLNRVAAENDELRRALVDNATQLRIFRTAVQRFVHGEFQTACVALSRRAKQESAESRGALDVAVASLSTAVDLIAERLDRETTKSFVETVDDLCAVWEGVMQIEVAVGDEVGRLLELDPVIRRVLGELIVEVVTNAGKHDNASSLTAEISLVDPTTLRLTTVAGRQSQTEATSRQAPTSPRRGAGTQLFNEVCLSWSITHTEAGSAFDALIPVTQGGDEVLS